MRRAFTIASAMPARSARPRPEPTTPVSIGPPGRSVATTGPVASPPSSVDVAVPVAVVVPLVLVPVPEVLELVEVLDVELVEVLDV